MSYPIKSPRKLIEVALPLDAINEASAREKSIRHGHPSTLHLWWARRPLAAARAVIFAQMVNDPGYQQGGGFKYGVNKKDAAVERQRLFKILEELVTWENTTNEEVLERARAEIRRSWREVCALNQEHPQAAELFNPDKLPGLHDPFAGGGSIPLEAQRLGLEAYASDLNPVAVLINKAMIEIPPKFANLPPVNPGSGNRVGKKGHRKSEASAPYLIAPTSYRGAQGLAEDVRYYGEWMRDEAEKRIGPLYPKVEITAEMAVDRPDLKGLVGQSLTVIAWLWARTVKSPNPAFSEVDVPLVSTFMLSTKEGKEAYVEPVIEQGGYHFTVKTGKPKDPEKAKNGTKLARGANFACIMSNTPMSGDHIKGEGISGRMGARLMAIVAEGERGRVYLPSTQEMEIVANQAQPNWKPDLKLSEDKRAFWTWAYGLTTYGDLFTRRQLVALTTFSDLVQEARERVLADVVSLAGEHPLSQDATPLDDGGVGAQAYADAVGVYLAFAVDKCSDYWSSICSWHNSGEKIRNTFGRQAIPMVWDYAESNPLCSSSGNWMAMVDWTWKAIGSTPAKANSFAAQHNAQTQSLSRDKVVSTDPPYYDNIGYADLSDFFYVWLRRSLRSVFPMLFSTIAVPKAEELIATPYRHGSKLEAEVFFLDGMTTAMRRLAELSHAAFPVTIYYAFKQAETENSGTSSTGWETFLEAVLQAGFAITGTWPMRTELGNRMIGSGTNALASSIVLVCRRRSVDARVVSRRDFIRELNTVLPEALDEMTKGAGDDRAPVAPVDLSQAIIGPGMAVFSKYAAVLEADGTPMSVRVALQLINRFLAEDDFDADTQFCLHWFDQYGWAAGPFGEADVLARAKGTSVGSVQAAGVVETGGGKVRLRRWTEYPADWDPQKDSRIPVWEALHQLIRVLKEEGEHKAGELLTAVRNKSNATRQLAYRLYTLCERHGWAEDARAYNELITSWDGIELAAYVTRVTPAQSQLFDPESSQP